MCVCRQKIQHFFKQVSFYFPEIPFLQTILSSQSESSGVLTRGGLCRLKPDGAHSRCSQKSGSRAETCVLEATCSQYVHVWLSERRVWPLHALGCPTHTCSARKASDVPSLLIGPCWLSWVEGRLIVVLMFLSSMEKTIWKLML